MIKSSRKEAIHDGFCALLRAWVEIESRWQSGDKGHKIRFRTVGTEELIGMKDYISMDSPMAHALLKKEVGDEAIVKTATGQFVWRITKIEYQK